MADLQDMILPLLRELGTEMREGFRRIDLKLEQHDKLERRLDNLRQAVSEESVLGRYAAAEVDERLEALERRLEALETRS